MNRGDLITLVSFSLSVFSSPYFHLFDPFDSVSGLLDKHLFSDSKSDIVVNVFFDALVKIVQRGKTYPTR